MMLCYVILPTMLCYTMLYYGFVLSYATLRYTMLCYTMLCYATLCYAMLRFIILCYAMLCYTLKIASTALLLLRHNFLSLQLFLCSESLLGSECTNKRTLFFMTVLTFQRSLINPNADFFWVNCKIKTPLLNINQNFHFHDESRFMVCENVETTIQM